MQVRSYTDKEGNKRTAAEVIVDTFDFCERKQSDTQTPTSDFAELEDEDDDLPFNGGL